MSIYVLSEIAQTFTEIRDLNRLKFCKSCLNFFQAVAENVLEVLLVGYGQFTKRVQCVDDLACLKLWEAPLENFEDFLVLQLVCKSSWQILSFVC
jgi:hypothetical protein